MAQDKVTEIILDRLIKSIEEDNCLPWQNCIKFGYSFNWYTKHVYTGINRWILPQGEYMTKNQLNEYNEKHGTNYTFQKGIKWLPVLFCKKSEVRVKKGELDADMCNELLLNPGKVIGNDRNKYFSKDGVIYKSYLCRRYSLVSDVRHFADADGNKLPLKIDTGEVVFEHEDSKTLFENYLKNSGVTYEIDNVSSAYYSKTYDKIVSPLLEQFVSEAEYYSAMYHEVAHSTGTEKRLNRKCITDKNENVNNEIHSREELVAEMCSCLLRCETGIDYVGSSVGESIENSVNYMNPCLTYLKNMKDDIVYIAADADKAFNYIMRVALGGTFDDTKSEIGIGRMESE